jgi:hypothetical protein
MGWKPEYAAARRAKYQSDPEYREKRKAQGRPTGENQEYMSRYYADNREQFAEYRKRPDVADRRRAARRERYASDEKYREKVKERARRTDPKARRAARLRAKYGIGADEFDELLAKQGGRCAICPAEVGDKRGMPLYVDHCHRTGKVRGLLCADCNFGIGKFRDDPALLIRAAEYLTERT